MSTERKKLLIIHSSDELYGSDRILLQVVQALKQEWELTVWLPTDHQDGKQRLFNELRQRGIAVFHIDMPILRRALLTPRGLSRFLKLAPGMVQRLRRAKPDRVYLMTGACLLVAPLARLAGISHVTVHLQEPWGGKERLVLRQLARCTDHRISISQTVAKSTGLKMASINIVHNAVPRIEATLSAEPPFRSTALPTYLVASRWNGHKGHGTLLRAWEKAGHPGKLFILGSAPHNGDAVDVPQLVEKYVSDPRSVEVVGQVEDPAAWFDAVDCMILPTDTVEGCGLVAIEAFRHGKPALVSDSGGPAEVVVHRVNGLIFPPQGVEELAQMLMNTTKDQLRELGARARIDYERNYTPERYHASIREELANAAS